MAKLFKVIDLELYKQLMACSDSNHGCCVLACLN